jgi:hypothetical protein
LLYLVANRRRYGEYSGDILISGMNRGTYFNENTAFMTEVRARRRACVWLALRGV